MVADFSHLPSLIYRPDLIARIKADGERATDETLLEIFNRITPPLLRPPETAVIVAILSRKRGRRPRRGVPSLQWLSRQIAQLDRPDVHASFLSALSERIASPKGFIEFERSRQFDRPYRRQQRDSLIRGLYREFYELIENDPSSVQHEVLGEVRVPQGIGRRRARAAKMTHEVLRCRLRMIAPAEGTIIKIASMIQ